MEEENRPLLVDNANLVVYQCESDGSYSVRLPVEFDDGRFEELSGVSGPDADRKAAIRERLEKVDGLDWVAVNFTIRNTSHQIVARCFLKEEGELIANAPADLEWSLTQLEAANKIGRDLLKEIGAAEARITALEAQNRALREQMATASHVLKNNWSMTGAAIKAVAGACDALLAETAP